MKKILMLILGLSILLLGACASPATETVEAPPVDEEPMEATQAPQPATAPTLTEAAPDVMDPGLPFELISTAFEQGQPIPVQYSCDGEDISPSLAWGDPPGGTQSLVLIMDDPDAPGGTWDHWIVFDIPPELRELPDDVSPGEVDATFGQNSWGRSDYGGPCPPGGTHRYFFKLYALDTTLSLDANADKNQVLAVMDGHVLAETELMGTFSR